jgi:thioredoxin-dependent peroxiredoxin
METRTGEAFEAGVQLTVEGRKLKVGDPAPDFALEFLEPKESSIRVVRLADSKGKVRLLNVVNSLDTPVCHVETRKWEQSRSELPEGVIIYTISMDLPYAQNRWRNAEKVGHEALSAHQSEQFGQDYGVLLKEWRLLQRAVFVIDRDDRIAYAEYVNDQMREPNYTAAMEAVRKAAGG